MIGIIALLGLIVYLGVLINSMNILALSGIILASTVKLKSLKIKAHWLYIIAVILGGFSFYFNDVRIFYIITGGFLGYAFFLLVMMVGVLPNKWKISRMVKRYRGVYSIAGFIFITPHAMLHVFGIYGGINLFGIAAYVIMIPLTIISFRVIRKQIDPRDWFRIQKAAYLIYGLLFLHLLFVSSYQNKIVYAMILTLYLNNKIIKEVTR